MQLVTTGLKLTEYRPAGADDAVDIRLRLPEDRRTLSTLDQLRLETAQGSVPISNFVERKAEPTVGILNRIDGARTIVVQANVAAGNYPTVTRGDPRSSGSSGWRPRIKTGDVDTAIRTGRTTVAAFRQLEDAWGLSATLYHLGWGLRQFGRFADAAPALEEAIDVARGAGLWNTAQWALADLAIEKVHLGDHDTARQLFDEAAAASREIGDGAGEVLAGYGYGLLAHVAGDWAGARQHYAVAVDAFLDLGTPVYEGIVLAGLGRCDEADGDTDAAQARYQDALEVGRRLGEPSVTASALEGLARLASAGGDPATATARFVEAAGIRERFHRPAPPHERADL